MMARAARLSALLEAARVRPLAAPGADPIIEGASLDSRSVGPGFVFFALPGRLADGESFVPEALDRGARAIVARSPRPEGIDAAVAWVQVAEPRRVAGRLSREVHRRPDESLTLVGITGTNGKTTVAYLVESIAAVAGRRAGRIGTVGYAFAGRERAAARTTPEAPDFYRMLAEMRDESVDLVVMEVSSHALALDRVAGAHFDTAAFLNLGRDHLDFHGSVEAYFEAKARLFDELETRQNAVLPADDPLGDTLRRRTRARVTTFGRGEGATVRLRDEHCGLEGSSAILDLPSGPLPVRTFLIGRFNLDNVAAAAACAVAVGLSPETIASGILAADRVPGRMERIDCGQPFGVIVDFAHTEAALRSALTSLRELTRGGRLSVVFGCGGDRDRDKRAPMGRAAAQLADRVWITSDNPRGEDPRAIAETVAAGAREVDGPGAEVTLELDRRAAVEAALAAAAPGDVVLIAGKGHETVQVSADGERELDDRVVAREALARAARPGGSRA